MGISCVSKTSNCLHATKKEAKAMTEKAILIADDDDNDVVLLKRVLKNAKILNPVNVVTNGEEAICYLKGEGIYSDREKFPYPVVFILNLQMPRRTGGEVLGWMQSQPTLPRSKVIILSGHPDVRQVQQAHHLGAESFLRKPPKEDELLKLLQSAEGLQISRVKDGLVLRLAALVAAGFLAKTVCAFESTLHF